MKFVKSLLFGLLATLSFFATASAQTWSNLNNPPPFAPGVTLLLTDGTVIAQNAQDKVWYKLTPDINGSYINGTWTQIASMPSNYGPLYYASAVLPDGRVFAMGGEYNFGAAADTNLGAIYDPVANTWTAQAAPTGWTQVGDAECCVLPNGTLMMANQFGSDYAILDPSTLTWTNHVGTGKADNNSEEAWAMLPDGTILTVDCSNGNHAEKFVISSSTWVSASDTPATLPSNGGLAIVPEMGAGILRPDGTVFEIGATGATAVYTPPATNTDPGTWAAGPTFPLSGGKQLCAGDAPACLLPNGNVLCMVSPFFAAPTMCYEFDGTNLNVEPSPTNAAGAPSYIGNLLMLPTGQVLYTDLSGDACIYTPAGGPNSSWRPTITSCATGLVPGSDNSISGTQFNGLSQCSGYGDDSSNATNYPLVRITNNNTGHVFYCKTHDHSTMAVATGSATVSTHFKIPAGIETGLSTLEVVANGIPSTGYPVNILALTVTPDSSSVTGGQLTHATFNLNFQVGAGDTYTVASSSGAASVPSGPQSMSAGDTQGTFYVNTHGVDANTSTTITVTVDGVSNTASIAIVKAIPQSVLLPNATTVSGTSVTGSAVLNGDAGPSGVTLNLSSNNAAASVPATVNIPAGTNYASFAITVSNVDSDQSPQITATDGTNPVHATLTVKKAIPSGLTLNPSTVTSGTSASGVVNMAGRAGPSGITLTVSSDDPSASPPASINIAAGSNYKSFSIGTYASATAHVAHITVTDGTNPVSASLTVNPSTFAKLSSANSSVTGGTGITAVVQISAKAGTGGFTINLGSDNAAATPPATVVIPAGSNYKSFNIATSPVATTQTPTITASFGAATIQLGVTVNPPIPLSVSLSAGTVTGGQSTNGRAIVNGKAAAGGLTLNVTSSDTSVATVPATITVPAGVNYSSPLFVVSTVHVATQKVITITVDDGHGHTAQTTLTVNP